MGMQLVRLTVPCAYNVIQLDKMVFHPRRAWKVLRAMTINVSEIRGNLASAKPNREIGFGFVSCSCRACVRACVRAKLCGCVREVLLNAGGSNGKNSGSGRDLSFEMLSLLSWVLRIFLHVAAIVVGFKEIFEMLLPLSWVLR